MPSGFGLRELIAAPQPVLWDLTQPVDALAVHLAEDDGLGYLASLSVSDVLFPFAQDCRGDAAVDIEVAYHQLVAFGGHRPDTLRKIARGLGIEVEELYDTGPE